MNYLKFRRQFVLSVSAINVENNWRTITLKKTDNPFNLYVHPDLDLYEVENENYQLILLGYILDPFAPEKSNEDILQNIAGENDFLSVIKATHTLNGRFVIIYNDRTSVKLFNDATGFREIYYIHSNGMIACGSTPNVLSRHLSIPIHQVKEISDFYNSPEFNQKDHVWIGEDTVYQDVKKLLPNHYLDLTGKKTIRFWPSEERKIIKLNDAAKHMSKILVGTFDAACKRYELYQGLTSGWDTRLFLSACKKHVDEIHFYFFRGYKYDSVGKVGMDYKVAKHIAETNNFPLEIIEIQDSKIDKNFEEIYYQNNVLARPKLLPIYYDAFKKKLDNTKTVSGSMGNEILRLMSTIDRKIDNGYKIAQNLNYQKYPYIIGSINNWLNETLSLRDMNYVLIDLFHWEQYIGNWGALSSSEQDIVRDEIRPYNNRELLSTYISLKDKNRYKDYPMGHVKTIEILWKDLLGFKMHLEKYHSKKFLRFFGLEQLADKIYQRFK